MKNKIKNTLKKYSFLYSILEDFYFVIRGMYFSFFTTIFSVFKIDKNKVMVISYYGKDYGDNGKYITNKLLKKSDLSIYWALKKTKNNSLPLGVIPVKFNSILFLYHLATSKVWLNNTRFLNGIRKRKKQIYIQIWHGNLALKKVEYDSNLPKNYKRIMKEDNKKIDLMISNSDFCTNMYRNSFRFNGEICQFGTPRNDIFINPKDKEYGRNKILKFYNIDDDANIILYAPTFREDYTNNPYDIDFDKCIKLLEKKTKCKWKLIIRFHPLVIDGERFINSNNYINGTNYPDMQELINSCNLVITDYSSTMFDSMIAEKPVIIYANDIEKYKNERGYYFSFDDLPFPFTRNNAELQDLINTIDIKDILNNYAKFKKKVNLVEDGKASEKVAHKIVKIIEGDTRRYE